jgi:hypothetical protein
VLADGSRSRFLFLGSLLEPSDRMHVQYARLQSCDQQVLC